MTRILDALRRDLESSGLKPGTSAFDREYRLRRVLLCKEAKAVDSCWNCPYFDHCELIKSHLRDLYNVEEEGGKSGGSTPARS